MNHDIDGVDLAAPLPEAAQSQLARVQRLSLVVGIIGLAACALGLVMDPAQFFRSYLLAYVFIIGIVLGSLAIVMVHHLSGGAWGLVIRRILESATRTLPLMAVLFVPLVFGLSYLYPWARPAEVAASAILQQKRPYLNVPFFLIRAAVYFAAWIGVASLLNRWSLEQDRSATTSERRFRLLSAPGLMVYGLTVTFAAVDWIMSLVPEWYSTIFGVLIMGGQGLSAMAFVVAALFLLSRYRPLAGVVSPAHFHDLGKLLLAFVMLWAYFSYSQLLIIWSGNLPEEIPWYLRRIEGGWLVVSLLLVLGHFMLPFLLLLSRDLKRDAGKLAKVAAAVLVMRLVDLFWMIAPTGPDVGPMIYVLNVGTVVGLGGVWLSWFVRELRGRPLLPFNDPYLREAMEHAGH